MGNLYRLIYTSARAKHCNESDLRDILEVCQKNNTKRNITGILIHTDRRFLQYMEGEKEEVLRMFERIKADDRHGGCIERACGPIKKRLFPSWSMGYKDADSLQFDTVLAEKEAEIFRNMVQGITEPFTDMGVGILRTFFKVA